jgi:hypothetical protein
MFMGVSKDNPNDSFLLWNETIRITCRLQIFIKFINNFKNCFGFTKEKHRSIEKSIDNAVMAVYGVIMGFQRAAYIFDMPMATLFRQVETKGNMAVVSKKKKVYFGELSHKKRANLRSTEC